MCSPCFFPWVNSVQFSHSVMSDSLQPLGLQHTRVPCPSPNSQSLLNLMSIESLMPSNHLILCCHLLLPPLIFPSIRVFSSESVLSIRWLKYLSLSFTVSPSNDYSGLISFRIDWLDLLAVQGDSQEPSPTPQFKSINQFSFQSQRKAMPKNVQTTTQLHSSHRLAK